MKKNEVHLSKEFKIQTSKAIIAIVIFVLTYLIILLLGIGLTVLCVAGSVSLIILKPMFATLAIGAGFASMGIFILIFLLKFIFKSHKVDRSHLVQIFRSDEPDLFDMIDEIVLEVKTSYPKNVYLSANVNAAVFYDSNFWSMFLPIKKNLQLGLGLVNAITKEELKAILSHEFGHFSQRTMKVGAYVYNVNQVIFNVLYDNKSYEELIQRWANRNWYFSFFVGQAITINKGIQWILRGLFEVVNKSYMSLSREMEFHADEIAASITGYEPLKSSLLRMSMADNSFDNVINYYNSKITDNLRSENLYKDQTAVIKILSEINNLPIKNDLPEISLAEQTKFDKSKLVIKDQWASHPTIKERIRRLEKTNFSSNNNTDTHANNVFRNITETQKQLTNKLFETVSYKGETKFISLENFQKEYKNEVLSNSFSKIFNGYYDFKDPACQPLRNNYSTEDNIDSNELFSTDKVDVVYSAIALKNDLQTIESISSKSLLVKTFDYAGIRYKQKKTDELIERLKKELEILNNQIDKNDLMIYEFFKRLENKQNKPKLLERLYFEFAEYDKGFNAKYDIYVELLKELQFVNTKTAFELIRTNFARIKQLEEALKREISYLVSERIYQNEITNEVKLSLELYISKTWEYFNGTKYNNENLKILYNAMHNYAYSLSRRYFLLKKNILEYQEHLMKDK